MNDRKARILIADDHPLFRAGVIAKLSEVSEIEIIAETGDGIEAIELIKTHQPDLAILDFKMPGKSGLEIARQCIESFPDTRIILLTMFKNKKILYASLDAGIMGYVLKDDAIVEIIKAVDTVLDGGNFISSSLTGLLLERAKSGNSKTLNLLEELTPAEANILRLISELKSNNEIAETLHISKRTVENHKVNIANKLELNSARDLLKFALQTKESLE